MSEEVAKRTWPAMSRTVIRRTAELMAAESLADLRNAPGRVHALTGDRSGQFALRLSGRHRLVFEPANDPVPRLTDGGIDLAKVTAVLVTEVVDYHGD